LVPSLLEKVHGNVKAGYDRFALFELGKGHETTKIVDGLPEEYDNIALVFTDSGKGETGAAYYQAQKYLRNLSQSLGVKLELRPATEASWPDDAPFELSRSATVHIAGQKNRIGIVGELKSSVRRSLKLPAKTAAFEMWIGTLAKHQTTSTYQPLSRFPKVEQDICLKVASDVSYQALYDFVEAEIVKANLQNTSFSLTPVDIYQKEDSHKQITLRLTIASYEKTMTDAEVSGLLDTVAAAAKTSLNAERI
jgi:phenylalanyl-tRNA synthetase beta subunit